MPHTQPEPTPNPYPNFDTLTNHNPRNPAAEDDRATVTLSRRQCAHIFTAGHRCGSPALRDLEFCFHHNHLRYPAADPGPHGVPRRFTMPAAETLRTLPGIQAAIAAVLRAIAADQVPTRTGALLLKGLQIASLNLQGTTPATPARRQPQP